MDWIDLLIQVLRFLVAVITLAFDRWPPKRNQHKSRRRKSPSR